MDAIWERRRRNLSAIIHYKGQRPSPLAVKIGLGVNTINAFLSGSGQLKFETLEKICTELGLKNVAMLDVENPMSEVRNDLFGLVGDMTDSQAASALEYLRTHHPELFPET